MLLLTELRNLHKNASLPGKTKAEPSEEIAHTIEERYDM
jgi:hypothetical protein